MNALTLDPKAGPRSARRSCRRRSSCGARSTPSRNWVSTCRRTTAKVKAALAGLPLETPRGPVHQRLVAILRGPANGRTVLLRGDMDALPLTEDTGLSFTSQHEGAMHACGHDTHVAMLAGAARALCERRDRLPGSVMFMFQPGEEGCTARGSCSRRPARSDPGRGLRPAHLAQHAARGDRQPRRPAAGLVR